MIPPTARVMGYLDPQWGETGAPWVLPKLISGLVRVTHRECGQHGSQACELYVWHRRAALWRHQNLNRETHEWLRHEFADVPLSFFEQILRSVEAGHLVAADDHPALPQSFVDEAPKTKAPLRVLRGRPERLLRAREPAPHPGLVRVLRPGATPPDRARSATSTSSWGRTPRTTCSLTSTSPSSKGPDAMRPRHASSGSAVGTLSSTGSRSPCPSTAVTPRRLAAFPISAARAAELDPWRRCTRSAWAGTSACWS